MTVSEPIEPELSGPPPRTVTLSKWPVIARTFFIVVLSIAAIALPTVLFIQYQNLRQLQSHGLQTLGQVTGKFNTSGRESTAHHLSYTYNVQGQQYTGTDFVPFLEYGSTSIGDRVPINYLANNPADHQLGPVTNAGITYDLHLSAYEMLIPTLVIVPFWIYFEWLWRRQIRLLRTGIAVVATIEDKYLTGGKDSLNAIRCNFQVGENSITKEYGLTAPAYDTFSIGSTITIIVDPQNTKNSMPYVSMTCADCRSHSSGVHT